MSATKHKQNSINITCNACEYIRNNATGDLIPRAQPLLLQYSFLKELLEIYSICVSSAFNLKQRCFSDSSWYLSRNGHDSFDCGSRIQQPCESLDWLLRIFYQSGFKANETLQLSTVSSLLFDAYLVVILSCCL